ncbi:UPF0047 protein YjbQ [Striga asiatica]|uniref:UPF0047 protein YjbQ n=1 Tax=Striga asiatica TaxID=4170 RepID=A0A5A7Q0W6_STRAF|nr:UPF0047 protein YjbQ [Striga asiatica]
MQVALIPPPQIRPPGGPGQPITTTRLQFLAHSTKITVRKSVTGNSRLNQLRRLSISSRLSDMAAASPPSVETVPKWAQKTVTISGKRRGCHDVTPQIKLSDFRKQILKEIAQDLSGFKCGLAHFFLQHTSASLTINENYDPDVRYDTETFLNRIVPEGSSAPWRHTLEGADDMPAHIKSSMFGCSLTVPITDGRLNIGTWQVFSEKLLL